MRLLTIYSQLNMASWLANIKADCKWRLRTLVGRDVYFRPQLKVPISLEGGRPQTGFGAWSIYSKTLTPESVVYSVGIGDDISFDLSLIDHFGVRVEAFDPTPEAHEWLQRQNAPPEFHSHRFGIAKLTGTVPFYPHQNVTWIAHSTIRDEHTLVDPVLLPVESLSTAMRKLGHKHIDLLKIDVEGAEYEIIDAIVEERLDVRQLVVEFHHRFPALSPSMTKRAVEQLNHLGFKIFAISPTGEEYSFLKVT